MVTKRGFLAQQDGSCRFVGCLHLRPLPGSPWWEGSMSRVIDQCLEELEIYLEAGADGLIIENTHDVPYRRGDAEPATIAAMAAAAWEVRKHTDLPVGIQILAAADLAALEVAVTCDLDFIRAEGFVFAHVADEGLIQGRAAEILRRRAHLAAGHIEVWTDVKKKHSSHAITSDLSIKDVVHGVEFFRGDGVILTGAATGSAADPAEVDQARGAGPRVVVGSGITLDNISTFSSRAEVLIVGSACKEGGRWQNPVDPSATRALIKALKS